MVPKNFEISTIEKYGSSAFQHIFERPYSPLRYGTNTFKHKALYASLIKFGKPRKIHLFYSRISSHEVKGIGLNYENPQETFLFYVGAVKMKNMIR